MEKNTVEINKIFVSERRPEWTALQFKPYRDENDTIIVPEAVWMASADVAALEIKVGDRVAI